jgi:hypothetical protein
LATESSRAKDFQPLPADLKEEILEHRPPSEHVSQGHTGGWPIQGTSRGIPNESAGAPVFDLSQELRNQRMKDMEFERLHANNEHRRVDETSLFDIPPVQPEISQSTLVTETTEPSKFSQLKDKAAFKGEQLKEQAASKMEGLKEKAYDLKEQAALKGEQLKEQAAAKMESLKEKVMPSEGGPSKIAEIKQAVINKAAELKEAFMNPPQPIVETFPSSSTSAAPSKLSEMENRAAQKGEQLKEEAAEKASEIMETIKEYVGEIAAQVKAGLINRATDVVDRLAIRTHEMRDELQREQQERQLESLIHDQERKLHDLRSQVRSGFATHPTTVVQPVLMQTAPVMSDEQIRLQELRLEAQLRETELQLQELRLQQSKFAVPTTTIPFQQQQPVMTAAYPQGIMNRMESPRSPRTH